MEISRRDAGGTRTFGGGLDQDDVHGGVVGGELQQEGAQLLRIQGVPGADDEIREARLLLQHAGQVLHAHPLEL